MSIVSDVLSIGRTFADATRQWDDDDVGSFDDQPRRRPLVKAAVAAAVAGCVGFVLGVVNAPRLAEFEADPDRPGESSSKRHETDPAKANDPSRGRQADSPTQIPARGWKDIAW